MQTGEVEIRVRATRAARTRASRTPDRAPGSGRLRATRRVAPRRTPCMTHTPPRTPRDATSMALLPGQGTTPVHTSHVAIQKHRAATVPNVSGASVSECHDMSPRPPSARGHEGTRARGERREARGHGGQARQARQQGERGHERPATLHPATHVLSTLAQAQRLVSTTPAPLCCCVSCAAVLLLLSPCATIGLTEQGDVAQGGVLSPSAIARCS